MECAGAAVYVYLFDVYVCAFAHVPLVPVVIVVLWDRGTSTGGCRSHHSRNLIRVPRAWKSHQQFCLGLLHTVCVDRNATLVYGGNHVCCLELVVGPSLLPPL